MRQIYFTNALYFPIMLTVYYTYVLLKLKTAAEQNTSDLR